MRRRTLGKTAASPAQDVRGFLKRSLAQALYLDEANIDDDRPFVDLGLDSIVGVEWVKNINKGLGLEIGATRVRATWARGSLVAEPSGL